MDDNAKELVRRGDKLFEKKDTLNALHQALADHFCPDLATFTSTKMWGEEFAEHLFDSSPLMAHRDLSNAFGYMLRPRGRQWFKADLENEARKKDSAAKRFLDFLTTTLTKVIYARPAQFSRATKECDRFFAGFGNGVLSCEANGTRTGLRFRNHHIKDCAWVEDADGEVDTLFRDVMMSARQMKQRWPEKQLHEKVRDACEKTPDQEFKVRHTMLPAKDYEYVTKKRAPKKVDFVSIYVDHSNTHLVSEAPSYEFRYVVPRWQTISGSPYAFSPAAMTSLADARMIQAMARVLLEAGEKSVDPSVVAHEKAIRGDINLHAGGVTWIDREFDEKLNQPLYPVELGKNVGLGIDLLMRTQEMIKDGWYLNKLNLPQQAEMTAYETAERIEEYIRAAIPLFEPAESTYNLPLLDLAFAISARNGAFGSPDDWPDILFDDDGRSVADVSFTFSNPLQDAVERQKVMYFKASAELTLISAQIDPASVQVLDAGTALRDAIEGSGAPAEWLRDEEEAKQAAEAEKKMAAMAQTVQGVGMAGQAAEAVGKGIGAVQQAGMPQQAKAA